MKGNGPVVEQGDLIGVRFKGNYGTYEFDNIFTTAEPYYMRAGVNTLVPVSANEGVAVLLLWHLQDSPARHGWFEFPWVSHGKQAGKVLQG